MPSKLKYLKTRRLEFLLGGVFFVYISVFLNTSNGQTPLKTPPSNSDDIITNVTESEFHEALIKLNSKQEAIQREGLKKLMGMAAKNHPKALLAVADLYFEGRYVKKDQKHAFELTLKASKKKSAEALNNLGFMYKSGIGTKKNLNKAFASFSQSASKGFPPALYNIGLCFEAGVGTQKNITEAVDYFRKAANRGHVLSQIHLGELYYKNDPTESVFWFRLAADKGNPDGMFHVATAHFTGRGAKQDYSFSFKYFFKASDKGHLKSMFRAGTMLIEGVGAARDIKKGEKLIKTAKLKGLTEAKEYKIPDTKNQFDLPVTILNATQGKIDSIIDLGWRYYSGNKVEIDRIESYAWFTIAVKLTSDSKHLWAKSFAANQLSIDQLIEAKKRAKQISIVN